MVNQSITEPYDINDLVKVMQERINELTSQNILLQTQLLSIKKSRELVGTDIKEKIG
jgi:hypothetical protein